MNDGLTIAGFIISIIGLLVSIAGLFLTIKTLLTAKNINEAVEKERKDINNKALLSNFKMEIPGIIKELGKYKERMDVIKVREILPKIEVHCQKIDRDTAKDCLKEINNFKSINKNQRTQTGDTVEMTPDQIEHSAKTILTKIITTLEIMGKEF